MPRSRRRTPPSRRSRRRTSSSRPAVPGPKTSATRPSCSRACRTRAAESFAGVANPWSLGPPRAGRARARPRLRRRHRLARSPRRWSARQGRVTGIDMTPEMLAKARGAAAELGAGERRVRRGRGRAAAVRGRELRRRHLERRHRPDPRQGRRLRRALPRARARRANPDRRRHDPATRSATRAGATSISGPAELPALCWKQSTPGSWSATASSGSRPGNLVDTYARSKFEDTRRKQSSSAPTAPP